MGQCICFLHSEIIAEEQNATEVYNQEVCTCSSERK